MADVRPFRALRPKPNLVDRVIAPPYDVLSESEAREIAKDRSSFVRVTRSEVDLEPGADAHSDVAYQRARTTLDAMVADGILVRDATPTFYLYGQQLEEHVQIGVLAGCSVAEYDDGRIARHEFTRPDKEDDRTHHMDVLDAQVGLVFLSYRPTAVLTALVEELSEPEPDWQVTTDDGVVHRFWTVPAGRVEALQSAFESVERLYIADGHHRSAAASRIHAKRCSAASGHFLAGLYPADRLWVMAYNRVVHDLQGHTAASFLERLSEHWEVHADGPPEPVQRGEFAMYLGGTWYRLLLREAYRSSDPVAGLDVSMLQDHLLGPVLGIDDPRRSERVTFVGGIHGAEALEAAVDGGKAVAFHLFPTGLDQMFEVADAGEVMPPKSTWFEPKLREGVVVRPL